MKKKVRPAGKTFFFLFHRERLLFGTEPRKDFKKTTHLSKNPGAKDDEKINQFQIAFKTLSSFVWTGSIYFIRDMFCNYLKRILLQFRRLRII